MIQPRVIFVFGSNLLGRHLGGAARDAARFWDAAHGVGVGPTGEAYALPTVDRRGTPMPIEDIAAHVDQFIAHAAASPDQVFYVTKIGCGIAGHLQTEIAPLFAAAPSNVQLPKGWRT